MQRALTQAAITALRPGDYLADTHVAGLRVEAGKTTKSFVYRYRDLATRATKQIKVGDALDMPIADARDAVRFLKQVRADGRSPQATIADAKDDAVAENVIEAAQDAYTVKSLIDDYASEHLAKTKRGWERERTLRQDLKHWYRQEAAAVTRKDVKLLITAIAERAPGIAGRVLRELRAAYLHALDKERLSEGTDPTHGVKPPKACAYVPRDRAFTEGEWRAWFAWLPTSGMSPDVQDALRLVALTACRPGEVTAARWRDIDLDGRMWSIREGKRKHSHNVHLSAQAVAILSRRRPDDIAKQPLVFPSPSRRGYPMRQHALVWAITEARADCPVDHWTAHDLRRSAATLIGGDRLRCSTDVIARVLGHYSIRRPSDIYNRATRDAAAKEAWDGLGALLAEFARPQAIKRRA